MRQLVITAFKNTVAQILLDLAQMPTDRWNESVFRFMFSRAVTQAATERGVDVHQFFECERVDIVLRKNGDRAFIEFKFYIHSPKYDVLSGANLGRKGYPSNKNVSEFTNCVQTLRALPVPPDVLKMVALFYADPVKATGRRYEDDYGDRGIENRLLIRRLIAIGPFIANGVENCNARLYEVASATGDDKK